MGLFSVFKEKNAAEEAAVTRPEAATDKPESQKTKGTKKSTELSKTLTEAQKRELDKENEAIALAQLVAGAPDVDAQQRAQKKFIGSNTRHMYLDGLFGTAVYTFSGLQHITGQSNALTLLSMWAAGTTFLINAGLRHYLNDVTKGLLPTTVAVAQKEDTTGSLTPTGDAKNKPQAAKVTADSPSPTAAPVAAASVVASAGLLVDYDTQKRNVFQLEAVASWIWMLAALQQFREHKRLRWCGYSSWSGLGCVAYYSMRYLYNVLAE